ncbi:uncharacterized protein LOC116413624 [Galleria mellonella]|uniref:Uncharacterized protein LOC116413624 n=1 Tax=Galleria mellonella TaxID=7137 RepID=A0ABM3MXU3_GALME|nr:uncharacterized protein LOC116413624 [Galleria mellonella]
MFYPVDSLKRGGRFYLCWVADSWPLRFATITQRQLWSQDIRKICDDLLEVMTNESGRPVNRFSLRLSSQLMRGLVRLYQRKVSVFLGDLCMINANVIKNINKKWNVHVLELEEHPRLQMLPPLQPPTVEVPDEPENEQRIAELIQNSGNIVPNIQDITLKESTIPEFQLPPNDGFGEENPDRTLQMVAERSVEVMLHEDRSAAQHSALGAQGMFGLDSTYVGDTRPSHDPQMEMISEYDLSMYRKSIADEILPADLFEKDIPEIPDIPIPEVPIPEIPAPGPQPDNQLQMPQDVSPVIEQGKDVAAKEAAIENQLFDIQLEELEDIGPPVKRRRVRKLIIDKKIKISADILHARIGNTNLELRCEDSSDDIVDLRLPAAVYFRRPCHAGSKVHPNIATVLMRLFERNLGVIANPTLTDREMEEAMAHQHIRPRTKSILQPIVEENPIDIEKHQPMVTESAPEIEASKDVNNLLTEFQEIQQQIDVSDLPTQKLQSPQSAKRKSDQEKPTKRHRSFGYITFRQHQEPATLPFITVTDADKENISKISLENVDRSLIVPEEQSSVEKNLMTMLEEAGLVDVTTARVVEQTQEIAKSLEKSTRKHGSDTSETPLGSLDRTKVSLGDSDRTTDSKRFIHDQWGTTGTMVKILNYKKMEKRPLTVRYLISKGPVLAGYKCIIAARCFTSILKLKQHGFICVSKDPETLEVTDIFLGPKFDKLP